MSSGYVVRIRAQNYLNAKELKAQMQIVGLEFAVSSNNDEKGEVES